MKPSLEDYLFLCRVVGVDKSHELSNALRISILRQTVNWQAVVLLASAYLLTPALYSALKARSLLEFIDSDLSECLDELHRLNVDRNLDLKEQAIEIIAVLNKQGIVPILLKGGVSLFEDIFKKQIYFFSVGN